jgi:hypothetical protein
MTEDVSNIKCGCGFSATGPDQETNRQAFATHACFDGDAQPTSWYHALFTFEGLVIVAIGGWTIVEIIKALK